MLRKIFFLFAFLFAVSSYGATPYVVSVRTVYNGSNVTTSTPVTLISSSIAAFNGGISVFDSSGDTMELIITPAGYNALTGVGVISYMLIPPGGGGFPLHIGYGDEVQLIAVSGTPSSGTENDVNFFY